MRYILIITLISLLLVAGCDYLPKKDDGSTATGAPPTIADLAGRACHVTADKYLVSVGMQNKYYLKGLPMETCEVMALRKQQHAVPNLVRIFNLGSNGLKTEVITHMQTGLYDIWAICGDCTTNVLSVTVSGAPPPSGQDSDGDGWTDQQEAAAGTDPNDATDNPGNQDSDGDGWTDQQETDPNDGNDFPGCDDNAPLDWACEIGCVDLGYIYGGYSGQCDGIYFQEAYESGLDCCCVNNNAFIFD